MTSDSTMSQPIPLLKDQIDTLNDKQDREQQKATPALATSASTTSPQPKALFNQSPSPTWRDSLLTSPESTGTPWQPRSQNSLSNPQNSLQSPSTPGRSGYVTGSPSPRCFTVDSGAVSLSQQGLRAQAASFKMAQVAPQAAAMNSMAMGA